MQATRDDGHAQGDGGEAALTEQDLQAMAVEVLDAEDAGHGLRQEPRKPRTGAEALAELRRRHKQSLELCSVLIKDRQIGRAHV